MRLLFDQNLSRNLVGQVRDAFPESGHVIDLDHVEAIEAFAVSEDEALLVLPRFST